MRRLIPLALACVFALPLAADDPPPAPGFELTPYSAVYTVTRGRIRLGEMHTRLRANEGGYWEYRSTSRTTGLVSLFRSLTIDERSTFRVEDGTVVPFTHSYDFDGGRKNRDFEFEFDWEACEVRGSNEGETATAELVHGAVDRHSTPVAVLLAVATGQAFPHEFVMVDRAKIRYYENRIDGEERLELETGAVDTIRVVQQRIDDPERRFVTWLVPSLGYIPVRVESVDDDGADVKLELIAVER